MTKYYAGIGSRRTPPDILETMTRIAGRLCNMGYTLRSGGAEGADTAFERGGSTNAQIMKAEDATVAAMAMAAKIHPAWRACSAYAQRLHGRNCMIILGAWLNEPVDFVICWQDPAIDRGGTRLGMRLAEQNSIPVYNLAVAGDYKRLHDEQHL
jgi:hypothetical protein